MLLGVEIAVLLSGFITVARPSPTVKLTSNVTFNGADTLLCSSKPIQFTCEGTQLSFLAWKIDNELIEDYTLFAEPGSTMHNGLRVELTRFVLDPSRSFADFTSTLTAEVHALTNGAVVECREALAVTQSVTVRYSRVLEWPPVPSGVQKIITAKDGTMNLTLNWNESFTSTYNVELYCVTGEGMESGAGCHRRRCVSSTSPYHCEGLRPGRYGFRVQAMNCGDQLGEESEVFTIHPQIPASPNSCSCVPVYEQMTNHLAVVENTWTSVQNPPNITTGQNQDIISYMVSYTDRDGYTQTITLSASDVCPSSGDCAYNISSDFTNLDHHLTISVAAVNRVGVGEPCVCPHEIATANNFLTILPNTVNQTDPLFTCHFTSVDPSPEDPPTHDRPVCSVCYGTGAPCHTSTCLPPVVATPANDSAGGFVANVSLTEVEDGVHYQFQVTGSVGPNKSATVVGTFSTACVSTDLAVMVSPVSTRSINKDFIDLRCAPSDVGSLRVPHGVICYDGTSVGSIASYLCDDGYLIPEERHQRTCLANGNWEGDILLCVKPQSGHLSVGGVGGIVFLTIVTTIMGVVIGALVCYVVCLVRKSHKKEKQLSNNESKVQGSIQAPRIQVEKSVYVEDSGSVQYDDVRRPRPQSVKSAIDTRGNMAYQYGQVKQ